MDYSSEKRINLALETLRNELVSMNFCLYSKHLDKKNVMHIESIYFIFLKQKFEQ